MSDLKLHCSLPFPCPVLVLRASSLNAKAVEKLFKCTTFPFCFTVIDNPKLTITVSLTCSNGRSWKTASSCCILPGYFFSFMIQCNPSDNLGMLFEIILSGVVLVPVLARTQGRAGSFLSLIFCCTFCCQCVVQTVLNKLLWLFCVETVSSYAILLSLFRTIRKCDMIMNYLNLYPNHPLSYFKRQL